MKKGCLLAVTVIGCIMMMTGCIKNQPYITSLDPSLTATIGTYTFTSATVEPSKVDSQMHDSISAFVITGRTTDQTAKYDKIVLTVTKYKGTTGTWSIVQDQARASYFHSNIESKATGGIVAITKINPDNVVGYFSFNTSDGIAVKNGNFTVGLP